MSSRQGLAGSPGRQVSGKDPVSARFSDQLIAVLRMFRIVQTIWIDQIRSRDVRKEDGDIAQDRLGSDAPVRRVEARLALDEVRRALDRLSPDQRTALLLVTVEGLSYKEAAETVQVPVGTIMSRLARARIALQLQLEAGREGRGSTNDAAAH